MREHIDHTKPLVYEFHDLITGDTLVCATHDEALLLKRLADPSHLCEIIARNVRERHKLAAED